MLKKRRITIQTKKMNGMNANDFEVSVWFKIWKLVNYITSTYSNDRSTLYKSIRWATETAAAATSSSATTATATTYHQYIDEQAELWNVSSSTQHSTAQHTAHSTWENVQISNHKHRHWFGFALVVDVVDMLVQWYTIQILCVSSCMWHGMAWYGIAYIACSLVVCCVYGIQSEIFGSNGHEVDFSNYCVALRSAELNWAECNTRTICRVNGAAAAACRTFLQ